jgi:hypothetical protein
VTREGVDVCQISGREWRGNGLMFVEFQGVGEEGGG